MTSVVGIGSCGVDYFAIVPRLLGAEEKINADRMEIHAGGVTGNNLTQVARLGAKAGWLGLIGDDESGRLITRAFAEDGLDLSGIEIIPGEKSTFTWIPVDAQGERCIYMFPNVNGKLSPEQVRTRFAGHILKARHFHTEASQLPLPPVREAMRIAREASVRVILDLDVAPSCFAQAQLGTEIELLECCDFRADSQTQTLGFGLRLADAFIGRVEAGHVPALLRKEDGVANAVRVIERATGASRNLDVLQIVEQS